jgi:hypothetical protein
MSAIETPFAVFTQTCEAFNIPPGSSRIDAFLRLPEATQDAIWRELAELDVEPSTERERA